MLIIARPRFFTWHGPGHGCRRPRGKGLWVAFSWSLGSVKRTAGVLLFLVLAAGCATQPLGRAGLLDFIRDGQTTREEAYLRLGEPSAFFEGGQIMSFRLGQDDGGYFPIEKTQGFMGVRYSLILAFDDQGILRRHSLIEVKGH